MDGWMDEWMEGWMKIYISNRKLQLGSARKDENILGRKIS